MTRTLTPAQAASHARHATELSREARREMAAFMNSKGFVELFKEEVPTHKLMRYWTRIFEITKGADAFTAEHTEFTWKGTTYYLDRGPAPLDA